MNTLETACGYLRMARSAIDDASSLVDHVDNPDQYALIVAAAGAVNEAHNSVLLLNRSKKEPRP